MIWYYLLNRCCVYNNKKVLFQSCYKCFRIWFGKFLKYFVFSRQKLTIEFSMWAVFFVVVSLFFSFGKKEVKKISKNDLFNFNMSSYARKKHNSRSRFLLFDIQTIDIALTKLAMSCHKDSRKKLSNLVSSVNWNSTRSRKQFCTIDQKI